MNDHYFSDSPHVASAPTKRTYSALGQQWTVTTDAGVFSPSGLDKGTAVLLHKVPIFDLPDDALVADVGCGWGPITLALAHTYPQTRILASDVNERALDLASRNVVDAGFTNVEVGLAPDMISRLTSEIAAGQHKGIDLIWSNPPIRIGKDALHELLATWMGLLSPTGEAFWVVQKNLGADSLAKWLNNSGFPTEKIGSAKGFRVLHSRRR
ncbi:class I SAM-dependent methyltransferase [Arcanobacterium phocae]|uniref:Methyltransferase small domain-containing protein n=1 Tax=Arcanobacterium phocae TaxID=131112 RepID=A0A1H2LN19_9ACTO|nr:methyltransferase [Arcanobacterium phocae]SDU81786.1 Methyltransferase small domain-containing protein [Arcanobacterium phocae]